MSRKIVSIYLCFIFVCISTGVGCNGGFNANQFELQNRLVQGREFFDESSKLHISALDLIESNCKSCHGSLTGGDGGISNILNLDHLIETGLITPGEPFLGRLIGSMNDGSMPTQGAMDTTEVDVIRSWIYSGGNESAKLTPKCQLTSSKTTLDIPGTNVEFTLQIVGKVTKATLNSQSLAIQDNQGRYSDTPTTSTDYVAKVFNEYGFATCTTHVSLKDESADESTDEPTDEPTTKFEYFKAKNGPNGRSVNDFLVSECMACHTASPPSGYEKAARYFSISPNSVSDNFSELENSKYVSGGTVKFEKDLTNWSKFPNFFKGHKQSRSAPLGYFFTDSEKEHVSNFVEF